MGGKGREVIKGKEQWGVDTFKRRRHFRGANRKYLLIQFLFTPKRRRLLKYRLNTPQVKGRQAGRNGWGGTRRYHQKAAPFPWREY